MPASRRALLTGCTALSDCAALGVVGGGGRVLRRTAGDRRPLGGLSLAAIPGVGGKLVALAGLVGAIALIIRARRQRSCPPGQETGT